MVVTELINVFEWEGREAIRGTNVTFTKFTISFFFDHKINIKNRARPRPKTLGAYLETPFMRENTTRWKRPTGTDHTVGVT